jgi:hypothetical protein
VQGGYDREKPVGTIDEDGVFSQVDSQECAIIITIYCPIFFINGGLFGGGGQVVMEAEAEGVVGPGGGVCGTKQTATDNATTRCIDTMYAKYFIFGNVR